ncbi:DUF6646 family protein [Tamlana sp. I1]|uniref:DUF6646 family protein n=1 Tax=Tamlana sp. I1 TaxID=2762061 RepID=UPI0018906AA5|nr:DUF6646 family protein [Tamlana sp. I1]
MKKLLVIAAILTASFANAQAFTGKGDQKLQVGVAFQSHATGINVSYDHGIGESASIGFSTGYVLDVADHLDAGFDDRFDAKLRLNANLCNVINVDENFDLYPGLTLSLKNFGGQLGTRYFFGSGLGVFAEAQFPIAKYNKNLSPAEEINNQFVMNIGVSFEL